MTKTRKAAMAYKKITSALKGAKIPSGRRMTKAMGSTGPKPKLKKMPKMKRKAKKPRRESVRSLTSSGGNTEGSEEEDQEEMDAETSVDASSRKPSPRDSKSDATSRSSWASSIGAPSESHSSECVDSEAESDEINAHESLHVEVGSTFKQGRYKVHRKLGYGAYSTVWLAWDQTDNKYVALKIQNCSKDCTKAAMEEIKIHKQVAAKDTAGDKSVVTLLDHFEHRGSSHKAKHVCMVFEYLGDNLLTLLKANKYKGLPLDVVKNLSRQILTGLNYLHNDLKIIHTDLKPENVLLMSPLDPSKDPRNTSHGVGAIPKRHRSPTPAPPKVQPGTSEPPNMEDDKGDTRSRAGSRAASPASKGRQENMGNNEDAQGASHAASTAINDAGKQHVEETGQLTSEPSLDRLAIDSDPDIARDSDMYNKQRKCSSKANPSSPSQQQQQQYQQSALQQVKFCLPKPGRRAGNDGIGPIDIRCKIVDLGTACWTDKHFTDDIQTRPYRCPEVLLGAKYSTSADMWSFACLVFELATGNVLFNPRTGGSDYNRDEDHLAQITQILGPIPKKLLDYGVHAREYLTKRGELRRMKSRRSCPLHKLLVKDYKFNEKDAQELSAFLIPLLDLTPENRPTADRCLQHPWLMS